jgi:hypothetical protein
MEKKEIAGEVTEKRKHRREKTNVPVEVVSGGQLHKEMAKDVSFNGIFINNTEFDKYEVGQEVVLAFESKDGEAYTVEGRIVRKDENGAGIEFTEELVSEALKHAKEW